MSNGMVTQFEVIPTAKEAWAKVSGSKMPMVLAALVCIAIQIVIQIITGMFTNVIGPVAVAFVSNIIAILVLLPAIAGVMYMGLQRVRNLPLTVSQVFYLYKKDLLIQTWIFYIAYFAIFLAAGILIAIFSNIPALYLIASIVIVLALIYICARISLGIYFIFDNNEKGIDAIKHSYNITKPYIWKLIFSFILIGVAMFVGALLLMVGLIWTIPFSYIFMGLIYQKIASV